MISIFEMFTWELHATFLRNHNTRPQRTPSRGRSSPGDTQAHKAPTSPAATTARSTGHYTRSVALHPIRGTTPDLGRYTRTEEVHCLRIGCSAPPHKNKRGTGRPNHSSPQPATLTTPGPQNQARPREPREHPQGRGAGCGRLRSGPSSPCTSWRATRRGSARRR